jgi:hypothetical protein
MDPYSCILNFLDLICYYFFQAAPQLYSRGWVDPVPDPLLLRKSGSAENRTWDLCICSQKLWPLDHSRSQFLKALFLNISSFLLFSMLPIYTVQFRTYVVFPYWESIQSILGVCKDIFLKLINQGHCYLHHLMIFQCEERAIQVQEIWMMWNYGNSQQHMFVHSNWDMPHWPMQQISV